MLGIHHKVDPMSKYIFYELNVFIKQICFKLGTCIFIFLLQLILIISKKINCTLTNQF